MCLQSLMFVCVFTTFSVSQLSEENPNPLRWDGVYFPASTQTPCLRWNNSSGLCVCVCLGQTSVHPVNPSIRSTPLEALCANETFLYRKRIPPVLCTRPNQYSSCKTYFTEMALSQRVKEGRERDLSIIHHYQWPLRCEGILMILYEGISLFYSMFQGKFFCTSWTKWIF